jgi:hypothetical protein
MVTVPTTTIGCFAVTDRIDLAGVTYTSAATTSFINDVLAISAGRTAYTLKLTDLHNGTTFVLDPDASSGALVLLKSANSTIGAGQDFWGYSGHEGAGLCKDRRRLDTAAGAVQPADAAASPKGRRIRLLPITRACSWGYAIERDEYHAWRHQSSGGAASHRRDDRPPMGGWLKLCGHYVSGTEASVRGRV